MPYYPYYPNPTGPVDSSGAVLLLIMLLVAVVLGGLAMWYDYHRTHRHGPGQQR